MGAIAHKYNASYLSEEKHIRIQQSKQTPDPSQQP